MADHGAFQDHPDAGGQAEGDGQRDNRIQRQPLRRQSGHRLLNHPRGVRPQHQHLAVRHVDDTQQPIGDRQPQRRQQQDRAQRQPHKRLPKQIAPHQTVLDLTQALPGSGSHTGIRFGLRLGIRHESGWHVRVVRLPESFNRLKTHVSLRAGELEISQRQQQRLACHIVRFTAYPRLQEADHFRLRIPL